MLAFWRYHLPLKLSPEKAIYSMYHLVDKDTQDSILSHLVYESSLAARELGYHALHWWNRPTELNPSSFLETPSLLVSGEMDRITPPRINYQTAGLIHANVLGLKNHAHGILWEPGWDVICQKILLWLRSLNS
jgi:alpha-beta hydrolase superfamily lysophospholipase